MKKDLVSKLLRKNISSAQILGYALANLVGLSIIMTALQFYADANSVINGEEKLVASDYIIVSKSVSPLGGGNLEFSEAEIDEIASQPWATDLAQFTSSQYNVNASIDMAGRGMSTSLFFESVPDRFIDLSKSSWKYNNGDEDVPIILPKDYLSLYNFGFASSHGLPTISEEMIGLIPIRLSLSGNGIQKYFSGHIIGFSSRINTILVPEKFINYTNSIFAESNTAPSRIIIEVSNPGDPAVNTFLSEHNYDTGAGNNDNSRLNFFLTMITGIVITIGGIISLLSLFILLLSLHLLLQKNYDKIHSLMMLGYKPGYISRVYRKIVITTNVTVLLLATAISISASHYWSKLFDTLNLTPQPKTTTIIIGALIIFGITLINIMTINRGVKRYFY